MPPESSASLVPGPWTHRDVGANGTRLHIAELGEGPLVLLLHGFPEFWWCWREQMTALADAGYRAVAVDLRGYGASAKPPRGYDAYTLSADVASLVRALGERQADIVGHDWGGYLGWVVGALHANVVRRLVVVSMGHPRALASAIRHGGPQLAASRYLLGFQVPWRPERSLVADNAAEIATILQRWGGPGFPSTEAEARYREAMQIPGVVHSSMEYYRWVFRSSLRPDGARFMRTMAAAVAVPTLQIHGGADTCILPSTVAGNGTFVTGPYESLALPGVGHFPMEEAPADVSAAITTWIGA